MQNPTAEQIRPEKETRDRVLCDNNSTGQALTYGKTQKQIKSIQLLV